MQTLILIIICSLAVYFLVRRFIKALKSGASSCSSCGSCDSCPAQPKTEIEDWRKDQNKNI